MIIDASWNKDDRLALDGRLTTTFTTRDAQTQSVRGLQTLGFGSERDGLMFVPPQYDEHRPLPMLIMLHGAGGNAGQVMALFQEEAAKNYFMVIAPESRSSSWDLIRGGFGPDVQFLDRTLHHAFSNYTVDTSRIALAGFSDGASYALSLGLTNGHLFSHILAYSPGFMAPARTRPEPKIFLSHGSKDWVLPIEICSRKLKTRLTSLGYDLKYEEFDDGHIIPPAIKQQSLDWFLGER